MERFIRFNVRGDRVDAFGARRDGSAWYRLESGDRYSFSARQMDRLGERLSRYGRTGVALKFTAKALATLKQDTPSND